jgi:succinate dehydrogenase/fumarate reductase-like Fe-S protein
VLPLEVTLRVFRFDPGQDTAPGYRSYAVPWSEGLSVLEALRFIYEHIDGSLAFRNYHCGRGRCASCLLAINGRNRRGCHYLIPREAELTVEPAAGYPLVRDLVVEFGLPKPPAQDGTGERGGEPG